MKNLYFISLIVLVFAACKDDGDNIPILTPDANFTFTVNPVNYRSINFLNASESIHSQSKYLWYFGDGDSSLSENPVHEFKADGYYNVVLRVTNKELKDSYSCQILISNTTPDSTVKAPQLSFVYTQKGRDFTFQNTSSAKTTGVEYFWNFGENTNFTAADANGNIAYTFGKDGNYNVVLKAVYNNTIFCISKSVFVSMNYAPAYDSMVPVPSFSYQFNSEGKVKFINTSSFVNADTRYSWNFMNGSVSTDENPDFVDFAKGNYTVVLKVSNGNYTMSCSREIEVPKIDKPVALFVYTQNGLVAKFVNASSNVNANTSYLWVFGDGETSTEENPQHIYDASNSGKKFKVILKVINGSKSDVFTSDITIL